MILDSTENPIDNPQNFSPVSERQTSDWDVKNASKNYISLVLLQAASVIFAFAAVWILTRWFTPQGYGGIVAFIATSQAAQVCVNWTAFSLVRFGVDEFIDTQKIARVFWTRFSILVINIVLTILLAQLWYPYFAKSFNFLPETYWFVLAHFISLALWNHVQFSLQGAKMPRIQGFLLMLERIGILLAILFFWAVGKFYITAAFLAYIAGSAAATILGLFYLRHLIWARFTVDFDFYKKIILFSLPMLPFTLVGYFAGGHIDALFISKYFSTTVLGIYSVAAQMNGILLQVPTLAGSLLIPLFISLDKENQQHKTHLFFQHVLPSLNLGWCIVCALAGITGYYLIPRIFGIGFAGAIEPWWILVAATAVSFPVMVGYSALSHAISATYISMFAAIFAACTNIFFNFLLIPRYGFTGCAWSTVLAYGASVACFSFFLRKSGKITLSWTIFSLVPALAAAIVYTFTETAYLALIASAVVSILVGITHKNSVKLAYQFFRNSAG